jgi:HD-GYP domain-containing protein (c-di-GMP phosphodiesterase class II)
MSGDPQGSGKPAKPGQPTLPRPSAPTPSTQATTLVRPATGAAHTGAPGGTTTRVTIDDLGLTTSAGGGDLRGGANAFLYAWFQLFKTAQIHSIENQALAKPIQNFVDSSGRIVAQEGRVSFQAKDKALFQNSVKLKLSSDEYELAYDIFQFFEERGLGGFVIDGGLGADDVRQILRVLVYAPQSERKFAPIDAALRAAGLAFRVNKTLGTKGRSSSEVVLERRGYTFFTYSKLVVLYRAMLAEEKLSPTRRHYLVKKIARTIQSLVDICLEDDHTFLGVASVKSGDAYAPHHAANTAVLSIALGEKLGLSKVELAELGMAALFCDIGLRSVPPSIADKPAALNAEERAVMEQHPQRGVEFLLGEGALTRSVLTRVVVAFEHHRGVDGGGYPSLPLAPDLFSRIVAIAEAYDALTTDRPWGRAYLPDEALARMLAESGRRFDPVLLKVFVNSLGLYPVGTLVRLTTGELAVVIYGGGEAERSTRPIVALLGADGRPGKSFDLTEKDASGAYLRGIVSSEDPAKYGLQTSGLFAASPVAER